MPHVVNELPRLLSFKPLRPNGKRTELVPGVPMELTSEELGRLWADRIFQAYYADRGVTVDGWAPEGVSQARVVPDALQQTHKALPTAELTDPARSTIPKPEAPSKDPVEPTPMGGVPGNARQALKSVAKMEDAATLRGWTATETRSTILRAIDRQLSKLDQPGDDASDDD